MYHNILIFIFLLCYSYILLLLITLKNPSLYIKLFFLFPEKYIVKTLIKENKIEIIKKIKIKKNPIYLLWALENDHYELFEYLIENKNIIYIDEVISSKFLTEKYLELILFNLNTTKIHFRELYKLLPDNEELKTYFLNYIIRDERFYFQRLEFMIRFGNFERFLKIYHKSTKNGTNKFNPLLTACTYGQKEIIEFLIYENVIIKPGVLKICVRNNLYSIVEKLLNRGADINEIDLENCSEEMFIFISEYKLKNKKYKKRNELLDMNDENNQCVIYYDIPALNSDYYRCNGKVSHIISVKQLSCPYCKSEVRNVVYKNK